MTSELKKNLAAYESMKSTLESKERGRIALFSDGKLCDIFNDFGDGYMVGMERFGEGSGKTNWRAPGTARRCNAVCGTRPDRLTMPAFVGTIQGNQLIIKVLVSKPQVATCRHRIRDRSRPCWTREQRSVTQQVVDALGIRQLVGRRSWASTVLRQPRPKRLDSTFRLRNME